MAPISADIISPRLVEATQRMEEKSDPKAMTLLAELYANGLGVSTNDAKAAELYQLAADARRPRGDVRARDSCATAGAAASAIAVEAAKLFAAAAKLGHPPAAYNLALLYLEGQQFPQDFARAAELFRAAAGAGSPEAQYALATLYKEGRGVDKGSARSRALLAAAAAGGHRDAEVEYAIALFNGTGVAKDEATAAAMFLKAARQGNPVAQNRLAQYPGHRPRPAGRSGAGDQWHIIAKAGGVSDSVLDDFVAEADAG